MIRLDPPDHETGHACAECDQPATCGPLCAECAEAKNERARAEWSPGAGSPIGADEAAQAKAWNDDAPPVDEQLRTIAEDATKPAEDRETAKWLLAQLAAQ